MVAKFRVSVFTLAAVMLGTFGAPVLAEDTFSAGGCLTSPAAGPRRNIQDFLKGLAALLKEFPLGGADMTRKVGGLAARVRQRQILRPPIQVEPSALAGAGVCPMPSIKP